MAVSIPVFQGETGCQCIYSGLNQKCFIISFLFVTMIQNKQLIKYFPSIACVEYFEEWLRKTCINSYHVIQGEAWRGYLFVGFQVLQPSRNFYTWEYVHASIFFSVWDFRDWCPSTWSFLGTKHCTAAVTLVLKHALQLHTWAPLKHHVMMCSNCYWVFSKVRKHEDCILQHILPSCTPLLFWVCVAEFG